MTIRSSSSSGIPFGGTADRPSSPTQGQTFYNGELAILEIYTGTDWVPNSAPAGTPAVSAVDVGTNKAYGSGQATVTITPGTNGGPASSYNITATDGTNTYTSGAISDTTYTLTVGNSGTYNFTATGSNNFGTSTDATNYSLAVTTVPQAPTLSASVTTSAITITVGGSNGGKAISNYQYSTNGTTYTSLSPAQTAGPIVFSGLNQGTSYTYYIRAINANGTGTASSVTATTAYSVDYLVVGGGGGAGGYYYTGGGGGGGTSTGSLTITPGSAYALTIGAGGAQVSATTDSLTGNDGSNSTFHTYIGYYGGRSRDGVAATGAGGAAATSTTGGRGGGTAADFQSGAGGGGSSASAGSNGATNGNAGAGAAGISSSITGTATNYGGGGGGSGYANARGAGGAGGGGNGTKGSGTLSLGAAGTANTGGGGGGASHPANGAEYGYGWAGGSGVVILRIPSTGTATFSAGVSSSVSTAVSGYKIYTVTAASNATVTFS